jgi:hypothetical protein
MLEEARPAHVAKDVYARRSDRDLESLKFSTDLGILDKLTAAARILGSEGHSGGLAGQITARTETAGHFLTLSL